MEPSGKVPDAWDDDWVSKADNSSTAALDPLPSSTKLTKAERRAKQAELNRKLWEDADAPRDPFFLNFRGDVPLKSDFKPAMKVLSRKPTAKTAGATGNDSAQPDYDDGEDENDTAKTPLTIEERQKKAQREREEKQKKYEEARQRLFGEGKVSTTSPATNSSSFTVKQNGESRSQSRNKATRDSRPSSSAGNKGRQLYDPNYSAKPEKEIHNASSRSISEQQPIRNPRGPDASGRGGFGFAPRGSRGD